MFLPEDTKHRDGHHEVRSAGQQNAPWRSIKLDCLVVSREQDSSQ
jgi:hypothetical protein